MHEPAGLPAPPGDRRHDPVAAKTSGAPILGCCQTHLQEGNRLVRCPQRVLDTPELRLLNESRESSLVFLLRQVDPGRLPFGSLEPVEITQVLVRTQQLGLGRSGFVVVTAPVADVGDVAQVTVVEWVSLESLVDRAIAPPAVRADSSDSRIKLTITTGRTNEQSRPSGPRRT
jgi:hypothetical protein